MASLKPITRNLTALPAALLPDVKEQARVDGNYEDSFLKSAIGRAIDAFERINGMSVFETQWEWTPDQNNFCNDIAKVPVSPVHVMAAKDGAAVDITSSFTLSTMSTHGVPLYSVSGAWVAGVVFTLNSGYTPQQLPFGILDKVMRAAAHLYEHREILVADTQIVSPDYEIDATFWIPRA